MIKRILLIALLGGLALPAFGAISLRDRAPSFDGIYYVTEFPNGDKPVGGCTPPTGYTEASLGTGAGEICEQSATEFDFAVSGTNQPANYHIAHKDAGTGDVQIEARITDTYAGATSNFANVGIGIRETTASNSWIFQCHSLQAGSVNIQVQYGSAAPYTTVNGAAGTTRPRYCAVTYDVSTGDIKAHASDDGSSWTEVAATNRAMSDVIAYIGGTSRSTSETFTATIDNYALGSTIDAYTPEGGTPGGPTLVSQIENQTLAQTVPFTLSVADNFTGELSYTSGGLPGGGGLSFNTVTGEFTGAPDSDDVAASPFNVEVCAWTLAGGTGAETCDTAQFTVTAIPGDTFLIEASASARTYTCNSSLSGANGSSWLGIRTSGLGTAPGPGDTIVLAGGTHGSLRFVSCTGSDASRLTIRNDVSDNEPAVLIKTAGGAVRWFDCDDCINVDITGLGKWSGADSGTCGIDQTTLAEGRTQCGIQIKGDAAWTNWTSGMHIRGLSSKFSVRGVEVDGTNASNDGAGICFQVDDDNSSFSDGFRDDVTFSNNYAHDCNNLGEGFYLGPNGGDDNMHFSDAEISYNLCEDTDRDCITLKQAYTGANSIHHNHTYRSGLGNQASQDEGISVQNVGNLSIYSNYIEDPRGPGILSTQNTSAFISVPVRYFYIFNNIIVRPGVNTTSNGSGIRVQGDHEIDQSPLIIYNNTIIEPDNIIAGVDATPVEVSGCTNTNNSIGTVASQNFVAAGSDNYELSSTSPACNAASDDADPVTDYEDEARNQDSGSDQGADEASACP
jgi:hypothetical protein